ncbi:helix-turn-helix transcriptional regulator [Campylobacter ureolyticus]|uniref:helix-turn-helix transcriptional regulator n=1 Tax=Campylobacter ureolyticus TaxID=827 RepID=UPI0022B3B5FB|nr:WYL domain-containing protein [Campylobacter ureolyticus]MCZ6168630.1 WYL domain-containing protein [Campylobacter ureolyticus]
MGKEYNKTERIFEIFNMLNDGKKLTIDGLKKNKKWYRVSTKTIERDLQESFKILEEKGLKSLKQKDSNGFMEYSVVNKKMFENFWDKDSLRVFGLLYSIVSDSRDFGDIFKLNESQKKSFVKINQDIKDTYLFLNKPIEKINDLKLLGKIERAIKNRQKIKIRFRQGDDIIEGLANPYCIVFMNENFHLICHFPDRNEIHKPRINYMEKLEITPQVFKSRDPNIEKFIEDMQSPFAKYSINPKPVKAIMKVDSSVARYFKFKKFFKSQNIVKEFDDGSLLVEYIVTQDLELLYFVLRWSTAVEVIEPASLRNLVKNSLKSAYERYR